MKVSGDHVLNAPSDRVWAALQDPAVLVRTIPGCQQLETTGPDEYRMTVNAGVASIKGTYAGQVKVADKHEPSAMTLVASGSGAPGTVDAKARVTLEALGTGQTRLGYDADAVVGGAIGGVGQRVLTGVARKMAGEFFGNVDRVLSGAEVAAGAPAELPGVAPAVPTEAAAPAAAPAIGQVFRAPEPVRAAPGVDVPALAGAALLGALIALAGVALGGRIARRAEGRNA